MRLTVSSNCAARLQAITLVAWRLRPYAACRSTPDYYLEEVLLCCAQPRIAQGSQSVICSPERAVTLPGKGRCQGSCRCSCEREGSCLC